MSKSPTAGKIFLEKFFKPHNNHINKTQKTMKKIAILGAAESGVGAAILARKQGMDVLVSDMGTIKPNYKALLDQHHIEWEEGHHTEDRILEADEVVKSPGIPDTAPLVAKLKAQGTPIISEIELAGRYTDAKMVCITGSNGKTTTTSLIYHIFQKAGRDVGLAGNIGHSLALQVAEQPHQWYVIELSSFQLDNMYQFRADIAVLMNITPDHLDRYGFKFENYARSKMRILQNLRPEDTFIYWKDDPVTARLLPEYRTPAQVVAFSESQPFPIAGAQLALPGRHNLYNQMAAAHACLAAGIPEAVIAEGLKTFPGVEHRLERVCETDGVLWINDSKATNVDACRWALEAMTRPTVLILGGLDKGNDYNDIRGLVEEKCCALVFLGKDNRKLQDFFRPLGLPIRETHSMPECVQACRQLAHAGQTVLLSPCCASFDLFKNMEDRGEQFKALARVSS